MGGFARAAKALPACFCIGLIASCSTLAPAPPLDAGAAFRDCDDCPEMLVIPAGKFVMGTTADDADRWDDVRESPAREVAVRRFAMARHEVTRAQFARYAAEVSLEAAGCMEWAGGTWASRETWSWRGGAFEQAENEPVVCISWVDAKAFAAWLARRTGAPYRLPTEAEWEYAARAGTTTSRFWGNRAADGCAHANMGDRSLERIGVTGGLADCDDGRVYTAPVGSYRSNAFGLFDMLGNVWEWTEDCWHLGYAGAPVDGSARLDGDCSVRVPRGASWNSHYRNVRSANRGTYRAAHRYYHIGFRVVRDLDRSAREMRTADQARVAAQTRTADGTRSAEHVPGAD